MLIDTHCHVNFVSFRENADQVIQRSLDNKVWLVNVGSQYSTSERAVRMAEKYEQGVYAVVGLHPIHLFAMEVDESEQDLHFNSREESFDLVKYRALAGHEKVVGIGEMGIDYFHMPQRVDHDEVKAKQKETFLQGVKLARELNKPIIIHTRPSKGSFDAYDDVREVIEQGGYFHGVVHCYCGTLEQAQKFIDMGLLISFTGIVTFKNAKDIQEIIKVLPLTKIMVETDAPYLAPEPYRGQRNEPAYVELVARKIAELKGIRFEEVAETTTRTAKQFYHI